MPATVSAWPTAPARQPLAARYAATNGPEASLHVRKKEIGRFHCVRASSFRVVGVVGGVGGVGDVGHELLSSVAGCGVR